MDEGEINSKRVMVKNYINNIVNHCACLLRSKRYLKTVFYNPLKPFMRRRFLTVDYLIDYSIKCNPIQESMPLESEYVSCFLWRIGVIRDSFLKHEAYIAACREQKVAYKTIDLFASDWIEQVRLSGCDAFVAWPSECIQEWKKLYDERLLFLTKEMGHILYPPYDALWLYGSKQRQRDWLDLHGIPHPKTWVYYSLDEALDFFSQATLPLVAKVDIGASAHGVWIVRSRKQGERLIRQAFGRGLMGECADVQARQWRHIMLQEYVPDFREWRIIRIGDSFFGYEKGKVGDFHSGSGLAGWFDPPRAALDLLRHITDIGQFRSIAMDVFEKPDGTLLVNEIQSVFGAYDTAQMYINGVPGRYRLIDGQYVFEEGRFCQNACCNLRIEDLLTILGKYKH